jgi:hypothetical protein
MAAREGLKAVDMFEAIERGAIKALWVMATNPAVSLPRAGEFRAALNKLDLFVVSETTLRNDTVEAGARVLLPAAAWGEKDGTVTNSERRVSRQRAFLPLPGEAQPDWWIVSEVAQQLGFTQAFAYRTPADIFREHAALSAFENDGQRDFDLGGLAGLADADYDLLDSVMWPLPESAERGEKRVFADGGFFTSDRRGRFIAPAFPQLRAATSEAFPLRLNTGRLRDQWHTMTRTGQSPRLGAHCPEPQVDIHPDDAAMAGLQDGGFARVTTQHASTVLRVCIRPGQQRGSIFAPIHWSNATASDARVAALAMADTDPFSGQPELKATPARVEPVEFACRGFALTRELIALPHGTWFARVAVAGGHGLLFATNELPTRWHGLAEQLIADDTERAEYIDLPRGIVRHRRLSRRPDRGLHLLRAGAKFAALGNRARAVRCGRSGGARSAYSLVRPQRGGHGGKRADCLCLFRRRARSHPPRNDPRHRHQCRRDRAGASRRHELRLVHSGIAGNCRTGRRRAREQQELSRRALLGDRPLDLKRARRELRVLGLEQEGIEPAAMVDALERVGRNAHAHRAPERVGLKRDVQQIGQEAPLGLPVRMAHLMPDLPGFAGQLATPRHGLNPLETLSLKLSRVRHRNRAMRRKGCGTYSDQAGKRQAYVSKTQRPSMMPKKPAPDLIGVGPGFRTRSCSKRRI